MWLGMILDGHCGGDLNCDGLQGDVMKQGDLRDDDLGHSYL